MVERIAMVDCIGAGKSTLARALGAQLGLEVFHLDRLWWQPGNYKITGAPTGGHQDDGCAGVPPPRADVAAGPRWIIDSGAANLDVRLSRADTVVFLDPPRRVCLWRVVKRHNRRRPDCPDHVRDGLGWLWLLLRWVWKTYPTKRRLNSFGHRNARSRGGRISPAQQSEVRSFLNGVATSPTSA
ncbi:MAG: hypothetical protein ACRDZ8_18130 [Acidimicrobiales bacterium]